ncbi:MAG TPA: hypothetical protein VM238_18475 [Phycisphaerae bacterium]|nr:hypothetical protein [Phycisphaerae bacterium]
MWLWRWRNAKKRVAELEGVNAMTPTGRTWEGLILDDRPRLQEQIDSLKSDLQKVCAGQGHDFFPRARESGGWRTGWFGNEERFEPWLIRRCTRCGIEEKLTGDEAVREMANLEGNKNARLLGE